MAPPLTCPPVVIVSPFVLVPPAVGTSGIVKVMVVDVHDETAEQGTAVPPILIKFVPVMHALPKFVPVIVITSPIRAPFVRAGSVSFVNPDTAGGKITPTVTLEVAVPLGPVHASVKVVVALKLPVDAEPLVGRAPDHPPDAVHELVFVEVHESVDDASALTVEGVAVKDVMTGNGITDTVTLDVAVPPIPLHASVNVVVVESAPVDAELLVA